VLDSLLSDGELIMLTPQICYYREAYAAACAAARNYFAGHETLLLADFRDLLGTSRKYAVAVLEYFDRSKITKKEGIPAGCCVSVSELTPYRNSGNSMDRRCAGWKGMWISRNWRPLSKSMNC
jgi:hypothetical protein